MFRSTLFATCMVAVSAWERDVKADKFQTEAYGVDNNNYGHQGYGKGYGSYGNQGINGVNNVNGVHGSIGANASHNVADSHNSFRQGGHQGQGHNQWTDNAWNQWGTNNHWDSQKAVDNKWGNNSGKINVNLNSVSGHYDGDYGQQKRGLGYEGHQNTSGEVGYTIGMGGHSFGYAEGDHSYGYENKADYGYGGWANNLGAWNHGANYDNFGNNHIDTKGQLANDADDTADVKTDRRVGYGYGDIEELDDDRQNQYGNYRVGVDSRKIGTGQRRGYGYGDDEFGFGGYGGYGYGDRSYGVGSDHGVGNSRYGRDSYGYGAGYGRDSYGFGDRSYNQGLQGHNGVLGNSFLGRGKNSYAKDW